MPMDSFLCAVARSLELEGAEVALACCYRRWMKPGSMKDGGKVKSDLFTVEEAEARSFHFPVIVDHADSRVC